MLHPILEVQRGPSGTLEEFAADMLSLANQWNMMVVCDYWGRGYDVTARPGDSVELILGRCQGAPSVR